MSLLETRSRAPTALRRRAHQGARWPWMLLPFARLLQTGLSPDRTTGQSGYWTAIAQPHYLQSLLNILLLSLAVTLITLLIAAVVGCFLAPQRFAGRGTLLAQLSMSLFHERGTLACSLSGLFISYLYFSLPRAIDTLNALRPQPDTVVITGDLVDFGAVEEYQTLQLLLRRLQLPFRLMPGNHDDRQAQREVFADHVYLQQGVTLNWQLKVGPLQQLALEFSVPEQPWGEIDAHQLRWLEQHLACEPAAPTLQYFFSVLIC